MHCHCLTIVTTRITFVVVMIEVSQSVMKFQQWHSSHITVRVSPSCFFWFSFRLSFLFLRFTNQEQCIFNGWLHFLHLSFFVFLGIRSGMFGDRGSLNPDSFDLSQQTQHLTGDTQNISRLETNMKSQHHHCIDRNTISNKTWNTFYLSDVAEHWHWVMFSYFLSNKKCSFWRRLVMIRAKEN